LAAQNINRCLFTGNLTRDPELRDTQGGGKVCRMRMAVNSRVKRGDEWTEKPNYINVVAFGRTAENAVKYLSKGSALGVDARVDWSEWNDEAGTRHEAVAFIVDNLQFLSSGREGDRSPSEQAASSSPSDTFDPANMGSGPAADDDIPF
jgi:single-strand DNA-binding protein